MRRFVLLLMCVALVLLPAQVVAGPRHYIMGDTGAAGGGASAWTDLTDTPGTITASQPVCGNVGGDALEFCTDDDVPESGDFGAGVDLEADGSLSTGVVADNEIDYSNVTLDDFDYQTAWRIFYSNADGDVTELAFGAADTVLTSQGASAAPIFSATGAGDVTDVWGCASGDCQTLTADGSDSIDATSANFSIPWVVTTDCSAVIAEGRACWDSDDNVLYVGDSAAAASWAASGDVSGVGDCASGACLDGTSDGGETISLYDGDSHKGILDIGDLTADRTYTFPDESGTIVTDQSDDDVPESGDFGNAYALEADGDLSNQIIQDYHIDFSVVTLDDFDYQNAWKVFYSDGSGDIQELAIGDTNEVLTSAGTSAAPTWTDVGGGDVLSIGECTSGDCFDGSTDGGNYIRMTDDGAYYTQLQAATGLVSNITITLPSAGATLVTTNTDDDIPESGEGDFADATDLEGTGALSDDVVAAAEMADADHGMVSWSGGVATVEDFATDSPAVVGEDLAITLDDTDEEITITQSSAAGSEGVPLLFIDDDRTGATANSMGEATILIDAQGLYGLVVADGASAFQDVIVPYTADGAELGHGDYEWSDLFLASSAVIYGENDQSNTITSSATGWVFNLTVSAPEIALSDADASPDGVGEFLYDNAITGLDDGGLVWFDDDEVRTLIDLDSSEGLASGDDIHVVTFNWNGGSGYYDLKEVAQPDETYVTYSASSELDNEYALQVTTGLTKTFGGAPPDSTVTLGCAEATDSTPGCAHFSDTGNFTITDEGDHSDVTLNLASGDTYTNFGDAADDTLDELYDAIDTALGSSSHSVGGSDGHIQYNNGGSAFGGEAALFWDDTNNRLGIGTSSPGVMLHGQADGAYVTQNMTVYSDAAYYAGIWLQKGDGTAASPGAIDSGDTMGIVGAQGYDSSAMGNGAYIRWYATENWSGTAHGSKLTFWTVDNTTTTSDERMVIDEDGNIGMGTSSPSQNLEVVRETSGKSTISATSYYSSDIDSGQFQVRHARGSEASPSALQSADRLGIIGFQGYDDAGWEGGGYFAWWTTEIWDASGHGTEAKFYTVPENSTTQTLAMTLGDDQIIYGEEGFDATDDNITNVGDIALDSLSADTDNGAFYIGDTDDLPIMRLDGTPASDDTYTGTVITSVNCGEAISQWDLVYMDDTANEWMQADANAAGEFPAVGMAVAACSDGAEGTILIRGVVRNAGWAATLTGEGKALYLSETAGGITETQPTDSGDCVQHIGRTLSDSNNTILFNPNTLWVEIG